VLGWIGLKNEVCSLGMSPMAESNSQ